MKIKYRHEEMCLKCEKKLVNGVRCTRCRRAWHWKCAGILKDQIKDTILQSNSWECHVCRISDKDCHSCKVKAKEIKSLKKNIIDLEKKLSGMNADLETHYSRITDLEDRLSKERNLRKRFEKNFYELEELQKGRRTCSSSSDSDSDDDRNRNSSSPSDTDDVGKRYNKRKTRRTKIKTVSRKSGESSKVNHDQGSAGAISKRQPIPPQGNKIGPAKSKQANKENRKKQTSQTIDWNEDTNEEVTGRHNESNYHLNSAIDYLQQRGHFDHENQGNEHESDPRPRRHWSPDNSNSTDGNVHENINRGVSTGYCFTFQRTGACTQKSCKFMHVHPSRPYGISKFSVLSVEA